MTRQHIEARNHFPALNKRRNYHGIFKTHKTPLATTCFVDPLLKSTGLGTTKQLGLMDNGLLH